MRDDNGWFFPALTARELRKQLSELREKLLQAKTLETKPNAHGIYAASASQTTDSMTGYQNAWLRDNAYVAYSVWKCGDGESALRTALGLGKFLETQAERMERIVRKPARKETVQERPHIRFNPETLGANKESWSHAQNDALGLTAWLRFRLANDEGHRLRNEEKELYGVLADYFRAIQYWKDRDSGAWEEGRKVNSSSVGAVMAGLEEMRKYLRGGERISGVTAKGLEELLAKGERTLEEQLPLEAPPEREADSATLFLLYPLEQVKRADWRHQIVSLVRARLAGEHGIRRYVGDSYFCQDYDQWFPPEVRSTNSSERMEVRDAFLQPGCEAQWCLFDPLLSVIYGERYLAEPTRTEFLEVQLLHMNRAIRQIDGQGRCPELYYKKDGAYVPNEHTPLAWTQANLALALQQVEASAGARHTAVAD
ncbi:MAG TPA: glycoside hydrolase family 15 protein [Candidatus Eisenbacteria bacterium]|nr:glycoside hydrolase family 15 protein [Candidatus Eisenbacteria bacterium]